MPEEDTEQLSHNRLIRSRYYCSNCSHARANFTVLIYSCVFGEHFSLASSLC